MVLLLPVQRQGAALSRPRHQPDERRHQAHLRPGQPAAESHPRARPLAHEAQIQARTTADPMCYFPAEEMYSLCHPLSLEILISIFDIFRQPVG